MDLPTNDVTVLRELAKRKAEIAADPINLERKQAWYNLDSGEGDRPMILAEKGGVSDERKAITGADITCESQAGRRLERRFRSEIYEFEVLQDDHVVEPVINVGWRSKASNYGVEVIHHRSANEEGHGSYKVEPPIKDLDADFGKLSPRTYSVDREATLKDKEDMEELFDRILPVRIHGGFWWSFGLTGQAIELIGLEVIMKDVHTLRNQHERLPRWVQMAREVCGTL